MSLGPGWPSQRVVLDKVHRLFVTLSYFLMHRFVQLLSLMILIYSSFFVVSIDLVKTGILARYKRKKEATDFQIEL